MPFDLLGKCSLLAALLAGAMFVIATQSDWSTRRSALLKWLETSARPDDRAEAERLSAEADSSGGVLPEDHAAERDLSGLDLIRVADPDFDEQDFRDRVAWLYVKIHHAITDQDLARVRDFTDDRALRSLQAHIDRHAKNGYVEILRNLQIDRITVVSVRRDGPVERVSLHIAATAAKSVVERVSGRLFLPDTNGDGHLRRRFVETWVLSRPAGSHSVPRPPLHRCPFCGAPVQENRRYVCTYCGTDLHGPEREWTILGVEFG